MNNLYKKRTRSLQYPFSNNIFKMLSLIDLAKIGSTSSDFISRHSTAGVYRELDRDRENRQTLSNRHVVFVLFHCINYRRTGLNRKDF